jgi:hypothetical protein
MTAINPMPNALAEASDGLTALSDLMKTDPLMTLKVFPFGVLMQRKTPHGETQYLVDPAQLALQLAANIRLETGLLSPNTIYVSQEGVHKIIVEHRPRKKTGIFLEGSDEAIVVPLPDLLMFRRSSEKGQPEYRVYAVKGRPTSLEAKLWQIPLPNVYDDGRVCWGSVKKIQGQTLSDTSLEADWRVFLGTPFGNHSVSRKSRSHPDDIRKKYIDMEQRKSRVYPKSDLMPTRRTVHDVIEELSK